MADSLAFDRMLIRRLPAGARLVYWFSRHWLLAFSIVYGLYVGLPFLAPIFMALGWERGADGLYFFYSFFCHQLPDRSFYFFGPRAMYSLPEIQAAWEATTNPLVLRQFVGTAEMGWKMAWSDRMVSMYGSILPAAWLWALLRRRLSPLPLWGFALLSLPLVLDGGTHFLSDLGGLDQGFRYTNAWLADLTRGAYSAGFYAGTGLGSFNSILRLATGVLFGAGIVWYGFPYLEEAAGDIRKPIEARLHSLQILAEELVRDLGKTKT